MSLDLRHELPFRIRAEGPFDPKKILVDYRSLRLPLNEKDKSEVDAIWSQHFEPYPDRYKNFPKVNINKVEVRDGLLNLGLLDTDYKTHISLRRKYRQEGGHFRQYDAASGIEAVVVTADNRILLSQRAEDIDDPGWMAVISGGFFEPDELKTAGPSVYNCFLRELEEEAGIEERDLVDCVVAGVIQEKMGSSTVVFITGTSLEAEEVLRRKTDGENHKFTVKNNPAEFIDIVKSNLLILSDTNLGTLDLFIKQRFDQEYAQIYESLISDRLSEYKGLGVDRLEELRSR
ncbi:MAG: hypothetical protein US19_C0030G0001, partial [Candidatus Daviesbacteria bacterium GW2011_GWB1_36_5]